MDQLPDFSDERLRGYCVYCFGRPSTRDHVPSRILLDEPYPTNLPVVPACGSCNHSFSLDEEYVACLIETTLAGSASPHDLGRDKIRRILTEKPFLAEQLLRARTEDGEGVRFAVDGERVENVVLKLARGHAAYELSEAPEEKPTRMTILPLAVMSRDSWYSFETLGGPSGALPVCSGWPEVGSRAMQRLASTFPMRGGWIDVQPGRYRYLATADHGVTVRMVLSEYLACEVVWA